MFAENLLCVIRALGKVDAALGKASAALLKAYASRHLKRRKGRTHKRVMDRRDDLGNA